MGILSAVAGHEQKQEHHQQILRVKISGKQLAKKMTDAQKIAVLRVLLQGRLGPGRWSAVGPGRMGTAAGRVLPEGRLLPGRLGIADGRGG